MIGTAMSFACGLFVKNGKDVVLGVDRLWVDWDGVLKRYVPIQERGQKSIRLNDKVCLAFTGDASCIARIAANLYGEPSIATRGIDTLSAAEAKKPTLAIEFGAVVAALDRIVPVVVAEYAFVGSDGRAFSVILGGEDGGRARIVYWCSESNWAGKDHPAIPREAIATLPPEALSYPHLKPGVYDILNGRGSSSNRIRKAIGYLAWDDFVRTVGKFCVMRRLSKGFVPEEQEAIESEDARRESAISSSPTPDPPVQPSRSDEST